MKVISIRGSKTYMDAYHFVTVKTRCKKCGADVVLKYTDTKETYPHNTEYVRVKLESTPCIWCGHREII